MLDFFVKWYELCPIYNVGLFACRWLKPTCSNVTEFMDIIFFKQNNPLFLDHIYSPFLDQFYCFSQLYMCLRGLYNLSWNSRGNRATSKDFQLSIYQVFGHRPSCPSNNETKEQGMSHDTLFLGKRGRRQCKFNQKNITLPNGKKKLRVHKHHLK